MKRTLKKLKGGGAVPYAQLGQIGSDLVNNISPQDEFGVQDDFAAGASGALSGAGTGAAIGSLIPGIGTAVGAAAGGVIGGISGVLSNNEAKQAKQKELNRRNYIRTQEDNAKLSIYDTTGSNNNQIYAKYGGNITKYFDGGNLKQLSDGSAEVEGASHEEGGVMLSPEVEVEGGETLQGLDQNEPFVFSEELGFAQLHKPIAKAIGKMEKKVPNTITNNSIRLLKQKEEALKMQQEEFKEQFGLKELGEYAYGGRIPQNSKTKDSSKFIVVDNRLIRIKK
jgi:hypothetical protein